MTSTRDRILKTLLDHPQATIKDLAEAVSINAISVRHHLASLQADGLVQAEEERHGVGRPRLVYSLTDKGAEIFPSNYLNLTGRLLEQLKQSLAEDEVARIFKDMAKNYADEFSDDLQALDLEGRLKYMETVLTHEGHAVTWEKVDGDYVLQSVNCPYLHVSRDHSEVCMFDETLFKNFLGHSLQRQSCICKGDKNCTYVIKD
ncbi:MAG: winged helix-turn-helix transcriptional regulator [Anaerolineaceae bacterium]|nr:winged helix-turn-helix transcriptional regulator [Anaerolineaceae bacterium]